MSAQRVFAHLNLNKIPQAEIAVQTATDRNRATAYLTAMELTDVIPAINYNACHDIAFKDNTPKRPEAFLCGTLKNAAGRYNPNATKAMRGAMPPLSDEIDLSDIFNGTRIGFNPKKCKEFYVVEDNGKIKEIVLSAERVLSCHWYIAAFGLKTRPVKNKDLIKDAKPLSSTERQKMPAGWRTTHEALAALTI